MQATKSPTRPKKTAESPWLTKQQAAKYLKCSEKKIERLMSAGRLPRIKEGRFLRFRQADLDMLISAPLMTEEGVAKLLKCSAELVRELADKGELPPPVKVGSLYRWRADVIDDWIQTQSSA